MDRLFREGAEKYEVKPSATAWDSIQGQVETKASVWPMVWKVAAVLVVLLSSVIVLFRGQDDVTETFAGIADHPQLMENAVAWKLPESTEEVEQVMVLEVSKRAVLPMQEVKEVFEMSVATIDSRPYLELQSIQVTWEIVMPAKPALYNLPAEETSVKIRYYASTSEPENTKKSFGQFIARAQQKLNPDELLADIRTAKDDLFRSNRGD